MEWLKQIFAKDSKPMAKCGQDKLAKACKCSFSMAAGLHAETCAFNPANLKGTLLRLSQDCATLEKQLVKTTMSPEQRQDGPADLAGLVVSDSSGSKAAPSAMASSGPKASPSVQATASDSGPSGAKKTKGWISRDKVIE